MDPEIKAALDKLFATDSSLYQERGFQRRIGWGKKPALVVIDMANAWTREDNAFTCEGMETVIPALNEVLAAFRAKGLPIIFTTTAYEIIEGEYSDMGLWGKKIPAEVLRAGSDAVQIDTRLERRDDEMLIVKKQASAFRGTNLQSYLTSCGVDTVVVTGATASACVRATVEDAIADGFRPIIVRECIGDRIAGAVEWNLYDMDAKFGDVEPLEAVLDHMRRNA
ncbi:MAG: isochorismatase family protein [Rhodospirillaceae bacterium]|jgi:N-carbamoylsarcosine amidase|nr:isochorismatase family protein [Rhodospirillaceae bacterium]MBT3493662.1 isochorismatase family protein [Rhodospirillaceae bacterium]MBT3780443.1 isochorismatase family protein [Rhodospirillaceae bacterium]MBT3978390.1 isochorismatase family protein [Rhodospirillaceae bacterium]MBT4169062.1 isochorismatase family protein [Rhodospirillaceae bacterium]